VSEQEVFTRRVPALAMVLVIVALLGAGVAVSTVG